MPTSHVDGREDSTEGPAWPSEAPCRPAVVAPAGVGRVLGHAWLAVSFVISSAISSISYDLLALQLYHLFLSSRRRAAPHRIARLITPPIKPANTWCNAARLPTQRGR